jgi:hypothetical protein
MVAGWMLWHRRQFIDQSSSPLSSMLESPVAVLFESAAVLPVLFDPASAFQPKPATAMKSSAISARPGRFNFAII